MNTWKIIGPNRHILPGVLKEGIKVRFLTASLFIKNSASSTFKLKAIREVTPKLRLVHFHSCKFTRFGCSYCTVALSLIIGKRSFLSKQIEINCTLKQTDGNRGCATRRNPRFLAPSWLGANTARFAVNVWEKSGVLCSIIRWIIRGRLTFCNFCELETKNTSKKI